jgi:hypothetical protein
MKEPSLPDEDVVENQESHKFFYRGKSIKDYMLTASLVLIGELPWTRLPGFIKKAVENVEGSNRDYLYHEELDVIGNFNDYLRIVCQLGLIENRKEDERKKHYYPTEYAIRINTENDIDKIRQIILDSVLNIVKQKLETTPEERHAILLLWYFLKLREKGIRPEEYHFRLEKDKSGNYYPKIRLAFTSNLSYFLFGGDKDKEQKFLSVWDKLLNERG